MGRPTRSEMVGVHGEKPGTESWGGFWGWRSRRLRTLGGQRRMQGVRMCTDVGLGGGKNRGVAQVVFVVGW